MQTRVRVNTHIKEAYGEERKGKGKERRGGASHPVFSTNGFGENFNWLPETQVSKDKQGVVLV